MKKFLFAGAALTALAAVNNANADSLPLGWSGSFDVGYARGFGQDGTPAAYNDISKDVLDGKNGDGLGLGVELAYRLRGGWDFGVGVSGQIGFDQSSSCHNAFCTVPFSVQGYTGTTGQNTPVDVEQSVGFFALDFTAGYDVGLGTDLGEGTTLRVYGGGRFAQFKQTQTATVSGYGFSNDNKSTFTGAGPRLGIESTYALGSGFSLFGGINGSILLGQMSRELTSSYSGYSLPTIKNSGFQAAYQAGGELGVGYDLAGMGATGTTLQVGYRADYWWNAVDNSSGNVEFDNVTGASDSGDVGFQGPFVRVSFQF